MPSQETSIPSTAARCEAGLATGLGKPFGVSWWATTLLFWGICPLLPPQAVAGTLTGNAVWSNTVTGGDQAGTLQNFNQRYNGNFTSSLSDAIGTSGGISYGKTWKQGGGSSATTSPNMTLNVQNDIFTSSLMGTASKSQPDSGASSLSQSWQANMASAWRHDFWPNLRLNYGQTKSTDDNSPRTTDTDSNRLGLTSDCDLRLARIYYNFDSNSSTDNISGTETTNSNHMAKLDASHTFWDRRLTVNFSEQYTKSISEFMRLTSTGTAVERAPQWTATPGVSFVGGAAMTTQQFTSTFNPSRQVDRLYFTPTPAGAFPFPPTVTIKNALLTTTVVTQTPTYDPTSDRYVLDVTLPVLPAGEAYQVEMTAQVNVDTTIAAQAIPITSASTRQEQLQQTSQRTDAGFNLRLRQDLPLTYNIGLETMKDTTGAETQNRRQSANLTWELPRYCRPSISFSETQAASENAPTNISRTYALGLTSTPLPTLSVSAGITKTDNLQDSSALSSNYNYVVGINAVLYPDLSSALSLSHGTTTNNLTGMSSSTWDSNLTFTARLSPKLTSSCTLTHNISSSTAATTDSTSTTSTSASFSLNARPSELLSIRANADKEWAESNSQASYSLNTSVTLLRTRKTQLTSSYNYAKTGPTDTHSINAAWSWALSRYITMQTSGLYTLAQSANRWSINSQLSSRF